MKKIIMWTFILGLFGCNNSKSQSNKIQLEKIEEMFSNMKSNGVNTDTTMLWGYFFTSNKKDKFDQVTNELKNKGFDFVEIFQAEDKSFWLHLERKEVHNAKSLYSLDEELYSIADKYKITYDGFDVGNVNKDKPIDRDTYVVPEEFKALDYQKDDFPCLLIGNIAFDKFPHKKEFCYFIKVTTSYKKDEKVMLPTEGELDELDKFEYFIENNLNQNKIKNYYVFRDTHKGIRNFHIITSDKIGATEILNRIKNSGKQRLFDFEILKDENWKLYDEFRKKMPKE
ncbi:DUF695 domain-containing protein [Flavobacterium bizetiae]|uniref:DUF695 domain-containing protein n=1 Tax=Flavobacterium bizetiae TaxID=2704140 RepID=UPI00375763F3